MEDREAITNSDRISKGLEERHPRKRPRESSSSDVLGASHLSNKRPETQVSRSVTRGTHGKESIAFHSSDSGGDLSGSSEDKRSDSLSAQAVTESTRNSSEDDTRAISQATGALEPARHAPSYDSSAIHSHSYEPSYAMKHGTTEETSKITPYVMGSDSDLGTPSLEERRLAPLVQPNPCPDFKTIQTTFHRVGAKARRPKESIDLDKKPKAKSLRITIKTFEEDNGTNGSSSGSGTEAGYAASASSNDPVLRQVHGASPSLSSSEKSLTKKRTNAAGIARGKRHESQALLEKEESSLSMSSELADFSSGASDGALLEAFRDTSEESVSITSSSNGSSDDQEPNDYQKAAHASLKRKSSNLASIPSRASTTSKMRSRKIILDASKYKSDKSGSGLLIDGKPPILALGCDIMAHVLTFLEPPRILEVLTTPLSHGWINTFAYQPELWRVLCYLPPFKAQIDDDSDSDSDESVDSMGEVKESFGRYRLIYTSFVKCMRYLTKIKEDAVHGRIPTSTDSHLSAIAEQKIGSNRKLRNFLARTRGFNLVHPAREESNDTSESSDDEGSIKDQPIGTSDDGNSCTPPQQKRHKPALDSNEKARPRFGHSKLTQRLLGPSSDGVAGDVNLPWSCAIYSIVNWMIAFSDAEGIQTMSLKVLPFILEDERQRTTAQRAGLTDVVLRAMVMFPDSSELHTEAFHTLVLLARPLGGREGMLFHSSMINTASIFQNSDGSSGHKGGIAVMLDSMKRFSSLSSLQAMSCWSLVNIALVTPQKEVLVKLGGLQATANAMIAHPTNAEVQFRALFALINLVIPTQEAEVDPDSSEHGEPSEREMLDEMCEDLIHLIVKSMKTFCSSESILNRACLVLHNLSLKREYHRNLILAPNCYQMLEWCLANYRTDQVLQQSAAGTLHRLQSTLSNDRQLSNRFSASIQLQQRRALEQALHEAIDIHRRQDSQA